jgi:hypothetical protein
LRWERVCVCGCELWEVLQPEEGMDVVRAEDGSLCMGVRTVMTGTDDSLAQSDMKRSIPAGIMRQKQLGLSSVPVILREYGALCMGLGMEHCA